MTSKKFSPMPRTSTGLPAGTSGPVDVGRHRRRQVQQPQLPAAAWSSRCSGLSRDSRWPRASTTEPTASDRAAGQFDVERSAPDAAAAAADGVAVVRWKSTVTPSGRRASSSPAWSAGTGRTGRGWGSPPSQPGEFGAFLVRERRGGVFLLHVPPPVERVPGQRRRQAGVLGDDRGVKRLRVHQVQPGLPGLPHVPRAGRVGIHHVDVQGGARTGGRPVGQQPLQDTGAPGSGPD